MVRHWVKWTKPVFPDSGGQLKGWELMLALSARLRGLDEETVEEEYLEKWLRRFLCEGDHPLLDQVDYESARSGLSDQPGPDRLYDVLIRSGRFGDAFGLDEAGLTVERLSATPEGLDFGPMKPQLPGMLKTMDQKIDLAPSVITDDLKRLKKFAEQPIAADTLLLIGRRHVRSKNSWMHNIEMLVRGKDRCTLMIHPDDASDRMIEDGETVTVATDLGALEIKCEVTADIMRGVVSIPHGWGHGQQQTEMDVANKYAGVNVNAIISEAEYDHASIISAVNGIRVRVRRGTT
jgi:anaerobic selenocysteine-containing dehydrogenase